MYIKKMNSLHVVLDTDIISIMSHKLLFLYRSYMIFQVKLVIYESF